MQWSSVEQIRQHLHHKQIGGRGDSLMNRLIQVPGTSWYIYGSKFSEGKLVC